MPSALTKLKAGRIIRILRKTYPASKTSLDFKNPFQLLIATILSAQCTDARVNRVTPELFRKFPGPEEMSRAKISELEALIRSTNFYKSKAKSLSSCSADIVSKFGGKVPPRLEDLVELRGVGRKTANVVLGNAFGRHAVVVDTHVTRVGNRLGLTRQIDPVKIEAEFMEIFPKKDWSDIAHLFIDHGRAVCRAPRPRCEICPLTKECRYYRKGVKT